VKACGAGAAGVEALRATAVSCGEGRQVMLAWLRAKGCAPAPGASRASCTIRSYRSYRCAGVRVDRGIAVGCARPGHAIAFTARRG
jgi:hypothetical protein